MTYYQEKQSQPFKWLLAIVVFILAMTITFSDVYGIWVPDNQEQTTSEKVKHTQDYSNQTVEPDQDTETVPPQIPEPATLILLGSGLAAMHVLRRRRRK